MTVGVLLGAEVDDGGEAGVVLVDVAVGAVPDLEGLTISVHTGGMGHATGHGTYE